MEHGAPLFLIPDDVCLRTDSDDPEISDKIAGLQRRNYAEHPEVAALVAQMASFRVPDGKG